MYIDIMAVTALLPSLARISAATLLILYNTRVRIPHDECCQPPTDLKIQCFYFSKKDSIRTFFGKFWYCSYSIAHMKYLGLFFLTGSSLCIVLGQSTFSPGHNAHWLIGNCKLFCDLDVTVTIFLFLFTLHIPQQLCLIKYTVSY